MEWTLHHQEWWTFKETKQQFRSTAPENDRCHLCHYSHHHYCHFAQPTGTITTSAFSTGPLLSHCPHHHPAITTSRSTNLQTRPSPPPSPASLPIIQLLLTHPRISQRMAHHHLIPNPLGLLWTLKHPMPPQTLTESSPDTYWIQSCGYSLEICIWTSSLVVCRELK